MSDSTTVHTIVDQCVSVYVCVYMGAHLYVHVVFH